MSQRHFGVTHGQHRDNGMLGYGAKSGVVRWLSRIKGYGFIKPDDGTEEVFVHYSAVIGDGFNHLYEGDRVKFDLVDLGRGPQAGNVRIQKFA